MKRLFVVAGVHFEKKMDAKFYRDGIPGAVVSRGPDHWKEQK